MKKYLMMAAVAITLGLSGQSFAGPTFVVNGVGSASPADFHNIGAYSVGGNSAAAQGNLGQGSGYYWAGYSQDTGQYAPFKAGNPTDITKSATVGNYLTRTGKWGDAMGTGTGTVSGKSGLNPPLSNIRAFGSNADSGKTAVLNTYGVSSVTSGFSIKVEVAGLAAHNELWYRQGDTLRRIFAGGVSDGAASAVSITGEFSLYLIRAEDTSLGGDKDKLEAGKNGIDATTLLTSLTHSKSTWASSDNGAKDRAGDQHFATFRDQSALNRLYVGVEDIVPLSGSDQDYNDLVVALLVEEVPAPPALVLVALGVPALGLARRFTRKTAVVA